MKRKVLILFCLVFISFLVSAQPKRQIVVIGKVSGDTKGYNKIYSYSDGMPKDSTQIVDGVFKFIFTFEKPICRLFYTEYDWEIKRGFQPFGVLIDKPGQVVVTIENIADGFSKSKVTGLQSAELFLSFTNDQKGIYNNMSFVLKKQYGKAWVPENDREYQKINKSRDSLKHLQLYPFILKYVKEHRDSYVGVFILSNSIDFLSLAETEECYGFLTEELKNSEHGKYVSNHIEGVKKSDIGSLVSDFSLRTDTDTPFAFAQMKGKYIVLDFWASWCGPCRASFPHMRNLYEKLKGKNVEFVNISIDKDKKAWLKAVEAEKNPWIQVLDTKNVSEKIFAVTSVPTTYLIDPNGKILMREEGFNPEGGGAIEKKLKLVFRD